MSIPAGVITVLVSAIPQTNAPVVPGTVSVTVTPSANLIWQTTQQSLATMCSVSPTPGWVMLPAVDQAGFVTPDTHAGVTGWSYLVSAKWSQTDGTNHTENGTIQCFSNQQVEYLSGTTGQLVPVATYPIGGIALSGWVDTYAHLPTGLTSANAGATYMVQADGRMYVWSGSAWPASGQGFLASGPVGPTGAVGPSGPANSLSVGTVQTGSPISITITGSAPSQTINFTLPEGHWWTGSGAPGTISGALNGDMYLDTSGTGNYWQLQSGTWVVQGSLLGPTGATGGTGATGQRGSKWFSGSGAPGTVTGAVSGDLYLDTSGTGNWYSYNGTSWSLQGTLLGPTGSTGATGASSTWRVGSGVPASGLGANGDMYLNSATGDIYGPKTSGAWGSIAENIVGPSAPQATSSTQGTIQLGGGDLGGSATAVTVPGKVGYFVPTVKTGAYTAAANDFVAANASGGAFTITLPTAPADKTRIAIKKIDSSTNAVNVALGGSDVFNIAAGPTTGSLALQNQALIAQYASSSAIWYVQSTDVPLAGLDLRYAPLASPTLTGTITLNGSLAGTGVAAAATANTLALRDANANTAVANLLEGYTSTVTAAGTTTLTVSSNSTQVFTGTSTQAVTLPVASTLVLGQSWNIINLSTGSVTVQSSGSNAVVVIPGGSQSVVTCILASGTSAASWAATAPYAPLASPTLTGTPTAPTATAGTSTTQLATTAFVASSYAPLSSPALTGTPVVPTAAAGTNTTQIASTAFVTAASQAAGGLTGTTTETANFSAASAGGVYPVSCSGGAATCTLPTAPASGTTVCVVKTDTSQNALSVTAGGSDVIGAAGTATVKGFGQFWAGTYRYSSGVWYPMESSAPIDITWGVQGGTRQTGYGDFPEGWYVGRNGAVVWVRWRAGTADASGTNTVALYSNTSNSATGTAVTSGSTTLTATSAGAVGSWLGPFTVAGGTYLQTNVTALATTPGNRLYMDVFGWMV